LKGESKRNEEDKSERREAAMAADCCCRRRHCRSPEQQLRCCWPTSLAAAAMTAMSTEHSEPERADMQNLNLHLQPAHSQRPTNNEQQTAA